MNVKMHLSFVSFIKYMHLKAARIQAFLTFFGFWQKNVLTLVRIKSAAQWHNEKKLNGWPLLSAVRDIVSNPEEVNNHNFRHSTNFLCYLYIFIFFDLIALVGKWKKLNWFNEILKNHEMEECFGVILSQLIVEI